MLKQVLSRRSFLTISAMGAAALAMDQRKIEAWARSTGSKRDYPTVVIGAGLGGLCCGAYLAKQGVPVTVLEQHHIPGGYATAFDRAGGKFRFEVSLHGTAIGENNASTCILRELGLLEKLDLVALPELYRVKTPNCDITYPQKDPEQFIERVCRRFPAQAEGIRGWVGEILRIGDEAAQYGKSRIWSKPPLKLLFPVRFPAMWNVRNKTLGDLMDAFVSDPEARQVLSAMWGYYGLPPSRLSAFYFAVATAEYLKTGSFTVRPRSQALSNLLADTITENGGRILYGTRAGKVIVGKGRVTGVITGKGDTFPARAVVCNASARTLFDKMVPSSAVPAEYLRKINSYRPSISSFIVWLGLNKDLRGRYSWFSTNVTSGKGPDQDYLDCINGDIDKMPFSVCLYDNLFDGYSAPGTSTMTLQALSGYEPWKPYEDAYVIGRKRAYRQEKKRWADTLIRRVEAALIPDLSGMIRVKEAATPLTNYRFTGNPQGAIYGFEQSMDNAYMNRLKNRTPVKGLYLAGAWGDPGGGYEGVMRSGRRTFQYLMEDWA